MVNETPKDGPVIVPLPANIKGYIGLYDAIVEKDGEGESPFKEEAKKAIVAFEQRITAASQNTTDRSFLEEYRVIAMEGSMRKVARKKRYAEERTKAAAEKQGALDDLKSEKDYTGKGIKAVIARAIPILASYKGLSTVLASADAVVAATFIVWGGTEILINKLSKTEEEKIEAKYAKKFQDIEDWFSHDKGVIYQEAEDKAQNAYEAYYGEASPFPNPKRGPTEPPPKLYLKEKRSIVDRLLFFKK